MMRVALAAMTTAWAMACALPAAAQDVSDAHRFVFLGAGSSAQYADLATLVSEGPGGRVRTFQVVPADFSAAGRAYWGGWSWWQFDCQSGKVDRLDFASVREGGAEGPSTPDDAPAYVAAQGGDAFEMVVAACNPDDYETDATTLKEAVRQGRLNLAR